ncbi:unnamed protein product [marine sediment metagenome]|uniref:Uncharacterized protein n=1 Tax=marine sediment metagenome TaxID=412755 RepID=X1MH85_9ZZZZ
MKKTTILLPIALIFLIGLLFLVSAQSDGDTAPEIKDPLAFEISYYPIKEDAGGYYSVRIGNKRSESIDLGELQLIISR